MSKHSCSSSSDIFRNRPKDLLLLTRIFDELKITWSNPAGSGLQVVRSNGKRWESLFGSELLLLMMIDNFDAKQNKFCVHMFSLCRKIKKKKSFFKSYFMILVLFRLSFLFLLERSVWSLVDFVLFPPCPDDPDHVAPASGLPALCKFTLFTQLVVGRLSGRPLWPPPLLLLASFEFICPLEFFLWVKIFVFCLCSERIQIFLFFFHTRNRCQTVFHSAAVVIRTRWLTVWSKAGVKWTGVRPTPTLCTVNVPPVFTREGPTLQP